MYTKLSELKSRYYWLVSLLLHQLIKINQSQSALWLYFNIILSGLCKKTSVLVVIQLCFTYQNLSNKFIQRSIVTKQIFSFYKHLKMVPERKKTAQNLSPFCCHEKSNSFFSNLELNFNKNENKLFDLLLPFSLSLPFVCKFGIYNKYIYRVS